MDFDEIDFEGLWAATGEVFNVNDEIESIIGDIDRDKFDKMTYSERLEWIEANRDIKPDQKEFLKEQYLKGHYNSSLALVAPVFFDKDEIKTVINKEKNHLKSDVLTELIKATEEVEKYLNKKKIEELGLNSSDIVELIKATEEVEKYLNKKKIEELGLNSSNIVGLIKSTRKVEKYLNKKKIEELGLNSSNIAGLIKSTGKIGEYLTKEKIEEFNLDSNDVFGLIKATGEIGEYLTSEVIRASKMNNDLVVNLMIESGNPGEYLTKEKIEEFGLRGSDVVNIIEGTLGFEIETRFADFIENELKSGTYSHEKVLEISEIVKDFDEANSAKLSRVKTEIALQIYELSKEERKDTIETIKEVFLKNNLPTFVQNFVVFQQLHPNLVGSSQTTLYSDRSIGNIPSLNKMEASQRNRAILTDLLKINIESNNRNLKTYLDSIEKGNEVLGDVIEGDLQIDDKLSEEQRQLLSNYCEILNSIYNQIRNKNNPRNNRRENSGDLQKDINELCKLYKIDKFGTKSLPDRIVKMLGRTLGIKSFSEAKEIIESIPRETSERNKNRARNGEIRLKKGDFAKGVVATEYIPSMFQNGIVAKDYLGQSADHDFTPCDMDCELITEEGKTFFETYKKMNTAPGYAIPDTSGKKMGKVLLIFENDENFVKTRNGEDIDENAVETVIKDKTKVEYFDNDGQGGINAYGIRTGLGSSRIKCIISDRYVDKLGLEIALNGFYIPVVNEYGQVIYTPEMYDQIREKMQGLSHYGLTEFQLDESAKNNGTGKLVDYIEQSKEEVSHKREMIIQTLKNAIEEQGLTMSTERELDLISGIVEVIDTGSTGRGTNEPGDGDFDFMMRMDKSIIKNPTEFKTKIRNALSAVAEPDQKDETGNGDFRYKGVSIDGLNEKVDVDLTFTKRTDEIEYTTEECIKDRLETIKRNNLEDYKYVVANILLAKSVLKSEGVYKKKNAAEPEPR